MDAAYIATTYKRKYFLESATFGRICDLFGPRPFSWILSVASAKTSWIALNGGIDSFAMDINLLLQYSPTSISCTPLTSEFSTSSTEQIQQRNDIVEKGLTFKVFNSNITTKSNGTWKAILMYQASITVDKSSFYFLFETVHSFFSAPFLDYLFLFEASNGWFFRNEYFPAKCFSSSLY